MNESNNHNIHVHEGAMEPENLLYRLEKMTELAHDLLPEQVVLPNPEMVGVKTSVCVMADDAFLSLYRAAIRPHFFVVSFVFSSDEVIAHTLVGSMWDMMLPAVERCPDTDLYRSYVNQMRKAKK